MPFSIEISQFDRFIWKISWFLTWIEINEALSIRTWANHLINPLNTYFIVDGMRKTIQCESRVCFGTGFLYEHSLFTRRCVGSISAAHFEHEIDTFIAAEQTCLLHEQHGMHNIRSSSLSSCVRIKRCCAYRKVGFTLHWSENVIWIRILTYTTLCFKLAASFSFSM